MCLFSYIFSMESHKVVEEYLTELLGKESTVAGEFIDALLKKWKPSSSKAVSLTNQDPLLEVYHRPNDEELVLMAAKKPSAKHKKQEGSSSQQPQAQRRNVQFTYISDLSVLPVAIIRPVTMQRHL